MRQKSKSIKYFGTLTSLLRDRESFLDEVRAGVRLPSKIISLLVCSSLFLSVYGAIIGAYHSWMQALSSAVKLPALYLITLLICLPTLFFASIIFGSKRTFGQFFAIALTAVSVTSVLLFSFASIALFFMISTNHYQFIILINVIIFSVTGYIGVSFLRKAANIVLEEDLDQGVEQNLDRYLESNMQDVRIQEQEIKEQKIQEQNLNIETIESQQKKPSESNIKKELQKESIKDITSRTIRQRIVKYWLFLYAFVGIQLGWSLRPFFGTPGSPFQLFRDREGNIYMSIIQSLISLLDIN